MSVNIYKQDGNVIKKGTPYIMDEKNRKKVNEEWNKDAVEEKVAKIRDNVKFCGKCGEYLDELGECSNPYCPQRMQ